jgi:hypothetical protein
MPRVALPDAPAQSVRRWMGLSARLDEDQTHLRPALHFVAFALWTSVTKSGW